MDTTTTGPRSASTTAGAHGRPASEYSSPLPRLTKRVFTDLAIWMTGLGLLMGIAFPFFVVALGVPDRYVLTPKFFVATLSAGLIVGAVNHSLSRVVVRSRLRFMRSKMATVEETLRDSAFSEMSDQCTPEKCSIPVDSEDELGAVVASFNRLVEAQATSHRSTVIASQFASILSSHIELTPLIDASLRSLQSAGRFSASALCLVRDGELTTVGANGIDDVDDLATSDLVSRAYRTLDMIELDLPEEVRLDGGVVTFRPRSVIAYPLHIRLVPIGVIVLASTEPAVPEELQLIKQLLPNLAVALNNALSHERLQRVAAIDPLTGLYNRRFGLERLSQDFSRSVRSKEPLGAVLFDIDHFKAVNDTYGHEAGDEVLKSVADAVKAVLREGDTLMRYGGEEFLAILPGAGEADVGQLGERIRRVVESTTVMFGQQRISVTTSLGAVSFPSVNVTDMDDLIRQADTAMYEAKNAGRNRLVFAAV